MRKASSRVSTSRARSASLDDAPYSSVGEQSAAAVKPPAEQHVTSRSSLQGEERVLSLSQWALTHDPHEACTKLQS
jgi:hypothetical protein